MMAAAAVTSSRHYGDICIFPRKKRWFRRRSPLQEPRWRASAGLSFRVCRILSR